VRVKNLERLLRSVKMIEVNNFINTRVSIFDIDEWKDIIFRPLIRDKIRTCS
jgi:hypothetical protein